MVKKKKSSVKKKHQRITKKCTKCGKSHSTSSHKSHGVGSFKRTHK